MTEIHQLHDDLHFVRQAVARREGAVRPPAAIYAVWAAYVLVGYTMLDFNPGAASWFFLAGGIIGGILTSLIVRHLARAEGEFDRAEARRALLHWGAGIVLAVAAAVALAAVIPPLRGHAGGQLIAVMIGLVYFLAGVHFDRNFLWLGPVLIVGGVLVGLAPRFGWTALGVVIATGLIVPPLFPPRRAAGATAPPGADPLPR